MKGLIVIIIAVLIIKKNQEKKKKTNIEKDPLYPKVVDFVINDQKASASLLQRQFKIGYNRATRLINELEQNGIVGPANQTRPREVLIKPENEKRTH